MGGDLSSRVNLRDVERGDFGALFEMERDPIAVQMAAFTSEDPDDRSASEAHWGRILTNDAITAKAIILDGEVVGSVASFMRGHEREVSYWIRRDLWSKGVGGAALCAFLTEVTERPMHARTALDNAGSIRLLEKCGFSLLRRERSFANARGEEIDEGVYRLP